MIMNYDFTSEIERKNMDAMAVDALGVLPWAPKLPKQGFDCIPMWVADMNFSTAPSVTQAIIQRAQHPIYGYFQPRQAYYDAIISWQQRQNHVTSLEAKHIGYANGVLGGLVSAMNVFCSRGDNVLIHAPTYLGFTNTMKNNGYNLVHSFLVPDENNILRMDYADMERKIVENKIHAAILCSPHNPAGRVWERWELEKAMELFKKYDVFVVSDEIWSDLVLEGYQHIPTQSISEDAKMRTVAMYSPSKTFNLAGLVGSYSIVYNSWIRDRMEKESSLCHFNEMNVLSMHALIGAYQEEGSQWLAQLRQVLTENVEYACEYIQKHFEGVSVRKPQGTYMLFVDCTQWCQMHNCTIDAVEKAAWEVGVAVQDGRQFHGPCHLRINLALPLHRVKEAFSRLDRYVFNA